MHASVCLSVGQSCGRGGCGVQGTLLHPCFVLSYYAQCLCRLFWGALCPPSQDWPGALAHLATGDATANMEQCMPRSSSPQCMCCAADDPAITAPGKCYSWAVQLLELTRCIFLSSPTAHGAHGVVVSHPLRMRKALGSNPSVSITCEVPFHVSDCPDSEWRSVHQ